ncbi:hypothetical protein KUTeg_006664 [Tegillarca granosa]|uniref:Uncharacterized protein n=1 Tax=Tegillarca granosa TaxID=220873 RepID=A0ABQ9FAY5_TEGGR|nr:hypothetical protein KUTeg_006664 [Tegillarca granosa]
MITARFKFFHSLRFCFPISSKNGLNHIKFISSCSKVFMLFGCGLIVIVKSVVIRPKPNFIDDGTLVVQFVEENHISSFGGDWLKENCYSKESLKDMRESLKPVFYSDKYVPELSYSDVKKSDEALYRWLKNINEYGLCLLKDVPTEKDMLKTVIRHIGPVEQSIYGETYELYVINIKWSPPYHGPIALEEDLIEPFYRAFILFGKAIENHRYKGGYVNIDDYKSKLMILHKKYGDGSPIRRVFNTDWS